MKKKLYLIGILACLSLPIFAEDSNITVEKYGNSCIITNITGHKEVRCEVVYRKLSDGKFNRELRCSVKAANTSNMPVKMKDTVKMSADFWQDFETLIFQKYNEHTLWHNSYDSIVKNYEELKYAELPYIGEKCKKLNGTYHYDVVTGSTSCGYKQDFTKGMTKQEKADYNKAKEFEAEYENYLRYRDF